MRQRPATSPAEFATLSSIGLRERLLVDGLFEPGQVVLAGTDEDRMVIGGVVATGATIGLAAPPEFGTSTFCENRELAMVCIEGRGSITVDGAVFDVGRFDVLYVGRGAAGIAFDGAARYYLVSSLAHRSVPTTLVRRDDAARVDLGDQDEANVRTIRKYIHEDGAESAQLVLGITELAPGSVWNTMPAHIHPRRTEIYLYTGLKEGAQIVHLAGPPDATRSIIVGQDEAVIAPNWSVHTGAGTSSYAFVWAMAGENRDYGDIIGVPMGSLR